SGSSATARSSDCSLDFPQDRQTAGMNPLRFGSVVGSVLACVTVFAAPPAIIPQPQSLRLTGLAPMVVSTETRIHADAAATPVANWFGRWSGLQIATSGTGGI